MLLLGVMLGGTVDAVACEPTTEASAVVAAAAEESGDHQLPGGDHDGVCIHGHCHHGVPYIQSMTALSDLPVYHGEHPRPHDRILTSIVPDRLKRPPRA
ncbi:hypothetical protein KK137_15470 [Croceibacterium sp. LX-88]|uniref:Secreted protein n=1 Tax=Croceibacterium selenioxidans TaxID=2838833 RepID=A0ABS5W7K0_9SPHN|nr:hypothetical protein [Croceibacterium selenioxidans]MBT2135737.1 hypothetical protein [Croceibacterium selenioxidans]